jgi:hypothetical protein
MMRKAYIGILAILLLLVGGSVHCQESVFNGLRSATKRADRYYSINEYQNALDLYLTAEKKKNSADRLKLKLGRTYFQLNEYENSALWYGKYIGLAEKLPDEDLYNFAEVLRSCGEYSQAIIYYKQYQELNPDDKSIIEKIWRLTNIQFLMEDSIYYSIKMANINSPGPAYSPAFYKDGLVFVADKMETSVITKVDGFNNTQFKTLYFAELQVDTLNSQQLYKFSEAKEFGKELAVKYNMGPLTFFPGEERMILTRNGNFDQRQGSRLQLFIAELYGDKWHEVGPFPYNSMNYSVSNPSLNKDGRTLYFVSDMPGGFGKKDLYVSYYENNTWSKPKNLGDKINTAGDEDYPFVHNSVLYFSSNGHGGLGGLDIYSIDTSKIASGTLNNLGYPANSSFDDFGIALNKQGTRGFISSNRLNGGFEDNIYEIEIDLQSYPLTIEGKVKYKELSWRESDREELLSNADLLLFDARRKIQVGSSKTDSLGYFKIEIPYASNYLLKIISSSIGEITVKLEIPKNKKPDSIHDIVIVKNKTDEFDAEPKNSF